MPRLVTASRGLEGSSDSTWLERAAKYVPGEVVAAFKATYSLLAAVATDEPLRVPLGWLAFAVFLVLTPVYLYKLHLAADASATWDKLRPQLIIATIAFVVWAYALGGPFSMAGQPVVWGGYREWAGGVVLILYTLAVGAYRPS